MSISQDIIEIVDHLSSKIGIVVDWSQQNIVAELQQLIIRFSHYKMSKSIIALLLLLVSMYFLLKFIMKAYRVCQRTNNIVDLPVFSIVFLIFSTVFLIALIMMCYGHIECILKAIYVPELLFLKEIKNVLP